MSAEAPLPEGTSEQDIEATYVDGVLEVRVPVSQKDQAAKRIEVRRTA